jgi:hypothetical protein
MLKIFERHAACFIPIEGIHMTDEELTGRFDSIDERFAGVNQRFDRLKSELVAFIKEEGAETRRQFEASIKAEGVTTRHHFDIMTEAMKADVKVIANGHDALRERVAGLDARGDRLETRQDRLEDRQLAMEHRQKKLETQ